MEYVGRMAEILLCVICLTLVPANNMLIICEQQKENVLQVHTEQLYAKLQQDKCLTKEVYGQFREFVEGEDAEHTFELMVARKYVMSAEQEGGAGYGVPMKIIYRAEIEEMLLKEERILLDGMVFVNLSIYGEDGLIYSCGGEIW